MLQRLRQHALGSLAQRLPHNKCTLYISPPPREPQECKSAWPTHLSIPSTSSTSFAPMLLPISSCRLRWTRNTAIVPSSRPTRREPAASHMPLFVAWARPVQAPAQSQRQKTYSQLFSALVLCCPSLALHHLLALHCPALHCLLACSFRLALSTVLLSSGLETVRAHVVGIIPKTEP